MMEEGECAAALEILAAELMSGETSLEVTAQRLRGLLVLIAPKDKARRGRPPGRKSHKETSAVKIARQYLEAVCLFDKKPAEAARSIAAEWRVSEAYVYTAATRHERHLSAKMIDDLNYRVGERIMGEIFGIASCTGLDDCGHHMIELALELVAASLDETGKSDENARLVLGLIVDNVRRSSSPDRDTLVELGRILLAEPGRYAAFMLGLKGIRMAADTDDSVH